MSALATLAAVAASLAALAYLAATDPKRRRAFRLPAPVPRRRGAAWAAVLLPGLLLPAGAGAAGFFIWLGAGTVLGWVIAAISPGRTAAVRQFARDCLLRAGRLDLLVRGAGRRLRQIRLPRAAAGATLEARVLALEAEVALLRARLALPAAADVVVVLPRGEEAGRASRSRPG